MDPQARATELMESADAFARVGYWAAAITAWGAALLLLWGAYHIQTNGLKVTADRVVTGGAATAVAVVVVLLAIALAGSSLWFLFLR